MFDLIYDFIRNTLIGQTTTIPNADSLAIILSSVVIVFSLALLIKLMMWCFGLFRWKRRN